MSRSDTIESSPSCHPNMVLRDFEIQPSSLRGVPYASGRNETGIGDSEGRSLFSVRTLLTIQVPHQPPDCEREDP